MFQWLKKLFGLGDDDGPIKSDRPPVRPIKAKDQPAWERQGGFTPRTEPTVIQPRPQSFGGATLRVYEEPAVAYAGHPEAVIVACFFNPQNSPYRLIAFQKWYRSIRHLNHRIIECLIGDDAESQLPKSPCITTIRTESLLFHKESLLNKVIAELPTEYQYVFWLDTDVLFTNPNWMVDGVKELQTANIIQPFAYGIHLERNELKPKFAVEDMRRLADDPKARRPDMWRSFCARRSYCYVHSIDPSRAMNDNYDIHGHVGFAWGARREVLDKIQLYDRALIGGADHIIAHAAAQQIPCNCISRAFTLEIDDVIEWSKQFAEVVQGKMGYVEGDLYHIWHGDIKDREYLKRIREFASEIAFITRRDSNGLWIYDGKNPYMKRYYRKREASFYDGGYCDEGDFDGFDFGFAEDMGYALADLISSFGQPTYEDEVPGEWQQPDPTPAFVPSEPLQAETPVYEQGRYDYNAPNDGGKDPLSVFDSGAATAEASDAPPVQSSTPAYEPGHWDYTPPGVDPAEDIGSTFS